MRKEASMPTWRPFTWVIVVMNVLFLTWIVVALITGSDTCSDKSGTAKDVCDTLATIGASIAVVVVASVWALVDVILGVLRLVTRQGGRPCTVCGCRVKEGVTVCPACGYDFRAAAGATPVVPTSAPGPP
jgi:hypothetical protein